MEQVVISSESSSLMFQSQEFTMALGLEFFGFEMILALELEASGSD